MSKLKKVIKGIFDSIRYKTLNPLRFHLSAIKPLSEVSDEYLIVKLKHEAHLLEKNIKAHYKEGHGKARCDYVTSLLLEIKKRNIPEKEILSWSETIITKYELWANQKQQQVTFGNEKKHTEHPLSVSSVRFWDKKKPDRSLLLDCIKVAQLAPASCNRQAFKVVVLENMSQQVEGASALNSSMFDSSAYRVFIFYNRNNYTEKFSAAIDAGMFAQNFILEAKKYGLGCCCCYASEHLERKQKFYRKEFNLGSEYYCLLTILVGYPNEVVSKPPRMAVDNIVDFYTR